jgi:PAS domain S-box-containing protein
MKSLSATLGAMLGPDDVPDQHVRELRDQAVLGVREGRWHEILQALPIAIYTTDARGRITFYNDAAADLWGVRPDIGTSVFCGSWKLYWPDGTPLPHDQCPMALALREGRPNRGMEAVAERPDGTRIPFLPYPVPLRDGSGELIGALNTLVDLSELKRGEETALRLASVVESSHDAIVSKDRNGIITSWNRSAERLFGYTEQEVVGRPITILIPADRHAEEQAILERIGRGERVEHFETIRRRKDGSLVELSLTISPIRNARGEVTGASKIARDITERRQAEEQQRLLLREMSHRVKNLLTVASGLVSLSARSQGTQEELVQTLQERLRALARAHELILPDVTNGAAHPDAPTSLGALLEAILSPFADGRDASRIVVAGEDVPIAGRAVTTLALLLHEFATNAAKHGALSSPAGRVEVEWSIAADELALTWRETGGPAVEQEPQSEGFGSLLARGATTQLQARISRQWLPGGLVIGLTAPLAQLAA